MLEFEKIYKIFDGRIPCKQGCSTCCQRAGDIILFPGESKILIKKIPRVKKYIYTKNVNKQIIELIKQPCPFLKKGRCSIEKNRPLDCRFYPFDYCLFNNELIVITSKSCDALKDISENQNKKIQKALLGILHKLPKKWLESAVLFGPCGNCDKKTDCRLALMQGYNDKD